LPSALALPYFVAKFFKFALNPFDSVKRISLTFFNPSAFISGVSPLRISSRTLSSFSLTFSIAFAFSSHGHFLGFFEFRLMPRFQAIASKFRVVFDPLFFAGGADQTPAALGDLDMTLVRFAHHALAVDQFGRSGVASWSLWLRRLIGRRPFAFRSTDFDVHLGAFSPLRRLDAPSQMDLASFAAISPITIMAPVWQE